MDNSPGKLVAFGNLGIDWFAPAGVLFYLLPMRKILELRVLEGYRVWLRFDDGVTGEVDFSGKAHTGVFSRWKDYQYFRRASIDADGQLVWDHQLDFSADSLWLKVTGQWPRPKIEPERSTAHA